jgi:thioredoxin-related protein
MTPTNKLRPFIALGILLFFLGIWWLNSNTQVDQEFIDLGDVTFHTSLNAGISQAKNLSRPVFLYFRSETCFWCFRFEEEALTDKRVTEILNSNFVLISIDTFKQKNIASNLNVRTTPYIIFFTQDGDEISRIPGYLPADDFLIQLEDLMEKRLDQ